MKKTVIAISSIALAGVLVSGAFVANGAYEKSHAISSQSALEIALNDAGINKTDATNTKSILDREGVHYVFDVEFDSSTNEYDYTINVKTGEIIEKDIEPRDDVNKTTAVVVEASTETTNSEEKTTFQTASTENNTDTISLDKAKNIAIDDAKVSADAVQFTKAKLDKDDGIQEYEIEFICNGKEYEYSINAKTGKIIDKDVETAEKTTVQQKAETSSANISIEKAKSIAIDDAKVSADAVKFTKAKLDKDDGIQEYEIEFICNGKEYEYSINAETGKIIDKDVESAERTTVQQKAETSSTNISIEKAKEIALNHANLSADDVRFEKVVLDKDDGIYEYEIEFTKGKTEYEYSINAKTGAIIEYDIDVD